MTRFFLFLTVFLTGAAVLIIEVVAIRILAPYFGNTIFSVSSVLTTILTALSLGYYFGGKLADARPSSRLFYFLICISGLATLLVNLFSQTLIPLISVKLSIASGPLVTSVVLFLLPALILGTLSPFAIKLSSKYFTADQTGQAAGNIFFFSTLGSIAGSLVTGFVLIPRFGSSPIIGAVSLGLVLLGLAGLSGTRSSVRLLLISLFLIESVFTLSSRRRNKNIIYSADGVYQKITIADSSDGRARLLFQDRNSSAGISLTSPELLFFYTRYYSLYKLFNPQASQVLAIGGGAYTIPQAYINADPRFQVDVAEIEPDLYSLSQKYFRVTPSDRLTNILVDGRTFLSRTPKTYDIIFADAYFSFLSIPTHLTSQEFFRLVHRHLTPDGIFIGNFIGNLNSSVPSYFLSQLKTVKSVFPHTLVFASQPQNLPTVQNLIIVASRQPFANITPLPEIPALPQNQVDTSQFDLTPHTIYTDDYNPSEYVLAQTLKSYYYTR